MHLPNFRTLIPGRLARFVRRLRADRRGNYSMIVALLLPVLTGFVGMGTEVGLWFFDQQSQQSAADSAAYSAAVYYSGQENAGQVSTTPISYSSVAAGDVPANAQTQALAILTSYGFSGANSCAVSGSAYSCTQPSGCSVSSPGTGTTCVEVNYPPTAGTYANSTTTPAFEVIVAQEPQLLFSRVLLSNGWWGSAASPVIIKARSVGVVNSNTTSMQTPMTTTSTSTSMTACSGSSCDCVQVTDASSTVTGSVGLSGSGTLNLNGCSLEVDSTSATALNLGSSTASAVSANNVYLANTSDKYQENNASCSASTQTMSGCTGVSSTSTVSTLTSTSTNPYSPSIPTLATTTSGGCSSTASPAPKSAVTVPTAGGYFTKIQLALVKGTSYTLPAGTYYICPGGSFSIGTSGTSTSAATLQTAPFPLTGANASCTNPYSCNGSNLVTSSDGVTIVLLGTTSSGTVGSCASFTSSGSTNLDLVPPPSGTFSGILFTSTSGCGGTSGGTATANISGASGSNLFGAIDLSGYAVTFSGNSAGGSNGCLTLIAYTLTIAGSAGFGNSCTGVGTSSIGPEQTTTTTMTTTTYTTTNTTTYSAGLSM